MDKTFEKFLRSGIDLSLIGIERREDNASYFCTPKGASIFGWAGVDGIHYCFVRGFGGMVFAVSPMNSAQDFVHPIARDFADFLRLLLACRDAAALEQAWMWDEAQFAAFLQENPPTREQKAVLEEIAEQFSLSPLEHPWKYIKNLQASFDYAKIKYTDDYYDLTLNPNTTPSLPDWKVYFDGNFWGYSGRDHAGTEIKVDKQFDWAGHHWVIPSIYACSKGLVVDFCMRAEAENIRAFIDKWHLNADNDSCENFTHEEQMQMELDNPLSLDFEPSLVMNGKAMQTSHGSSLSYNPCLPEWITIELEAKAAIEHYGLDTSYGWTITRAAYPWKGKRRPSEIKALSLTMEKRPYTLAGPHFKVNGSGDTVYTFTHPLTGIQYTLSVLDIEQQTIPRSGTDTERWVYPSHYIAMRYMLFPEPDTEIVVRDCVQSERPREIGPCSGKYYPEATNSVIAIIGGADGPTTITVGVPDQKSIHVACSALHFEPVDEDIEWRIEFSVDEPLKETFQLV